MSSTCSGHASTGTGAKDDGEDDMVTRAGAVDSLGDRETIRVIGDADFAPQRSAQVDFNWSSVEPGRARTLGYPGARVQ
jgi:hypothetical protein